MAGPRRIPEGYHTVLPHLMVRGAKKAIEFYHKAFGAEELFRSPGPDGERLMHATLQIGDSRIYLCDEFPEMDGCGMGSPQTLGGTSVTIHLWCEDVDAAFRRAVDAGAQVAVPLADQFWGDRYGQVTDPFGHRWSMGSHVRDVPHDEMQKAADDHLKPQNA